MKKIYLIVFLIILFLTVFIFSRNISGSLISAKSNNSTNSPTTVSLTTTPNPNSNQQTLDPELLSIPKINVSAKVEFVGLDKEGKMDIPKDVWNVAWYKLGAKPGEKGNAVFAGHLDQKDGSPAIFWDLNKLNEGDIITVKDKDNKEFTYKVVAKAVYDLNKFPLEEVFGVNKKARLNLITCKGAWDKQSQTYSERLVVYSELVN